ncbi:MAG TPA: uroporphyrinogen-III synthase [Candidatus Acidoferrum sp.]|nr:uroporphyrinogen-III synthase [Candidatus Acidoferrum sp.]
MSEHLPSSLAEKRIVITRTWSQCAEIASELNARRAVPLVRPLISFADPEDCGPLDAALIALGQFDWLIFTSAEAVRVVARRSKELGHGVEQLSGNPSVAAVGPVTAEEVRRNKLGVDYVAQTHNGLALAEELGDRVRGKKVLLPRSDRAKRDLPDALRRQGAEVAEVIAYRTLRPAESDRQKFDEIANGGADAILFFSPSAVQHFAQALGDGQIRQLQDKLAITAVGPVTAKALREAGVERIIVASETTAASVVDALEKHFAAAKAAPAGAKRA